MRVPLVIFASVFFAFENGRAACVDYRLQPQDLPIVSAPTYEIVRQGNLLYTAESSALWIVDVTDSTSPFVVGTGPGGGYGSAVSGTWVYVATGGGIRVVDASNPASPVEANFVQASGTTYDIEIAGTRLYLARGGGVDAYSIANPSAPALLGTYFPCCGTNLYSRRVIADPTRPDYAISLLYDSIFSGIAVEFLDFSDPASPILTRSFGLGTTGTPDEAFLLLDGNVLSAAYTNVVSTTLQLFDVSDLQLPVLEGALTQGGQGHGVASLGPGVLLWAAADLNTVDVTDPSAPLIVDAQNLDLPGDLEVVGSELFHAGSSETATVFSRIDRTYPEDVDVVGGLPATIGQIAGDGAFAYLLNTGVDVTVVDLADPATPTLVTTISIAAQAVDVENGWAALGTSSSLDLYDVTNPVSPLFLSSTPVSAPVTDVEIDAPFVHLVAGTYYQVVNATNPLLPHTRGQRNLEAPLKGVSVVGNLAYVIRDFAIGGYAARLVVLDWTSPGATPIKSYTALPGNSLYDDLECGATTACVLEHYNHFLYFFDLATGSPSIAPTLTKTAVVVSAGSDDDLAVQGRFLYAASDIYDISDPTNITQVDKVRQSIGEISTAGDWLLIEDLREGGLGVLPLQCGNEAVAVPPTKEFSGIDVVVAPNPTCGVARIEYALARNSHLRIEIFDVMGREIALLTDRVQPAGHYATTWNGEGLAGVSSGVYFVRFESGGLITTRRLVVVR